MTSRDFAFWLQGFFEINGASEPLTKAQVDMIRRHLALVFKHEIDPSIDKGNSELMDELNAIHTGKPPVDLFPSFTEGTKYCGKAEPQIRC